MSSVYSRMGMAQLADTTQKRLNRYKKKRYFKELFPKGKITHSMVIDLALDALDEKLSNKGLEES